VRPGKEDMAQATVSLPDTDDIYFHIQLLILTTKPLAIMLVSSSQPPWPVLFSILFLWSYNHQPGITVPSSRRVTWYLYFLIFPTYIVDGYKSSDSVISSTFNTYHKGSSLMQRFSHQFHSHCCLTSWPLHGPTDRVSAFFLQAWLVWWPMPELPFSTLPTTSPPSTSFSISLCVYSQNIGQKKSLSPVQLTS